MPKSTICLVADCCKPSKTAGYCISHYKRLIRHGDPLGGGYFRQRLEGKCIAPNCDRDQFAKEYCLMHYKRWRKHGDASVRLLVHSAKGDSLKFFNEVVLTYEGDDCLIWPFGDRGNGYGCMSYDGRSQNIHRLVCLHEHGEPPTPQHLACHRCGNGHLGCCNRRHIDWGTHKSNQEDRVKHGTHGRGERCKNSKLTSEQVIEIRLLYVQKGCGKLAKQLGERFGVSHQTIYGIWYGKSWVWLD